MQHPDSARSEEPSELPSPTTSPVKLLQVAEAKLQHFQKLFAEQSAARLRSRSASPGLPPAGPPRPGGDRHVTPRESQPTHVHMHVASGSHAMPHGAHAATSHGHASPHGAMSHVAREPPVPTHGYGNSSRDAMHNAYGSAADMGSPDDLQLQVKVCRCRTPPAASAPDARQHGLRANNQPEGFTLYEHLHFAWI